jgi:hypothetical protein
VITRRNISLAVGVTGWNLSPLGLATGPAQAPPRPSGPSCGSSVEGIKHPGNVWFWPHPALRQVGVHALRGGIWIGPEAVTRTADCKNQRGAA